MLERPRPCRGCPLDSVSTGFMVPSLAEDPYGVALIGEALGEDEAAEGRPFVGRAGFKLSRLIEWAGLDRKRFDIYNAVWCRPPDNKLEGTPYEHAATAHCALAHWGHLLQRARVVVPMGNVATHALLQRKGVLQIRGYVWPSDGRHIIPTVHPAFIQRGQSRWSAPFIHDIQKAVTLARDGMPPQLLSYELDPSPGLAYDWAKRYVAALGDDPTIRLAFDIETPWKDEDEEDLDVDLDAPDRSWTIERVGFSYRGFEALSVPWDPSYFAAIRLLLGGDGDKVVWNAGFDVPRLRRAGMEIGGTIHDGMVAWHILHSDLPKSLRFVATFCCPWQQAWKHLSGSNPAFYNATDADVELRSTAVIFDELRRVGLWDVYQRDVLDLDPLLVYMHNIGMPVDGDVRLARALQLDERQRAVKADLEASVPLAARRIKKVFKGTPKETRGLQNRPSTRLVRSCSECGLANPRKDHFRRLVKKVNPCHVGRPIEAEASVTEWYRLAAFSPSREQLMQYHRALDRALPMVWDKKLGRKRVSFGEKQIKECQGRYPDDPLYRLVLEYRGLDKLAGTYIGRPIENTTGVALPGECS